MVDIFLRELREEDALLSYQWRNDPEVWKFTGRRPDKLITEEIELTWIRNVLKRNNEKRFAICIEETNQYIGNIQLTAINGFDAEFHIFIGERSFWGKGIAQRATELISKYAFNELNIQSIYLDVKIENLAAIKVYERAGYKEIFRYDEYIRMAVYVADPPDKKLSVFIMTYNHEQFIEKALNSILCQKVDFEYDIVLGDDFSTDQTREIVLNYAIRYPGKFKLLFYPKNISALLNQKWVLNNCKGTYIAICEGDDYWTDSKKLQMQVDFLESNENYSMCCHHVYFLEGNKKRRGFQWDVPDTTDLSYLLRKGNYISTLSVVFRNKLEILNFLHRFRNPPLGDYLLYIANARTGLIKYIPKIMGVYRVHAGGIWSQLDIENAFNKSLQVIDVLFKEMGPEFHDDLRINLINVIEVMARVSDKEALKKNVYLKDVMHQLNIQEFILDYMLFSQTEKAKSSYYSKNIATSLLVKALKEKIRNRIPHF